MDFSSLLSSPYLLYGGSLAIALVVVILLVKAFSNKKEPGAQVSVVQASTAVAKEETQAITDQAPTLLSTEVAQVLPSTEVAQAIPAQVPPVASWKPSEHAAPIQADDKEEKSDTIAQSVEQEVAPKV